MLVGLFSTLFVYLTAKRVYRRYPHPLLTPILTSLLVLLAILLLGHIPYRAYDRGAAVYTWLLGPATVAFGVRLYKFSHVLRERAPEILLGVFAGTVAAIVSSLLLARAFALGALVARSLAPRSVTTPIAMDVSRIVGGAPDLTAAFVVVTGIVGNVMGPYLISLLRLRDPVARGVLYGTGSHGIGTAKAFEASMLEGTVSSLSLIVAGVMTALLAPWLVKLLLIA